MEAVQSSLTDRMMRAIKGDVNLFEEVERDESATQQAATVVGIVAVLSAVGSAVGAAFFPAVAARPNPIVTFIVTLVLAFVGWIVWSYITYFVGTRFFGGTATPGELLRTIGFAQTPQVLSILSFIPLVGGLIAFAASIWALWLGIVAIRQALDFDTGKAVLTAIIGFIAYLIVVFVITAVVVTPFAMMGAG